MYRFMVLMLFAVVVSSHATANKLDDIFIIALKHHLETANEPLVNTPEDEFRSQIKEYIKKRLLDQGENKEKAEVSSQLTDLYVQMVYNNAKYETANEHDEIISFAEKLVQRDEYSDEDIERLGAESGLVFSQTLVGIYYLEGSNGFQQNVRKAANWLNKAAQQGSGSASYNIYRVLQQIPEENSASQAYIYALRSLDARIPPSQGQTEEMKEYITNFEKKHDSEYIERLRRNYK